MRTFVNWFGGCTLVTYYDLYLLTYFLTHRSASSSVSPTDLLCITSGEYDKIGGFSTCKIYEQILSYYAQNTTCGFWSFGEQPGPRHLGRFWFPRSTVCGLKRSLSTLALEQASLVSSADSTNVFFVETLTADWSNFIGRYAEHIHGPYDYNLSETQYDIQSRLSCLRCGTLEC